MSVPESRPESSLDRPGPVSTPGRLLGVPVVSRWAKLSLVAVIAVYALLVVGAVRGRGTIWHDEAVSVIGATGHLDDWHRFEFEGAYPYGQWAAAADFQYFESVDRPFDLQGVSRSLGDYDWAPPGFFWLQHLALLAGVSVLWSGPVVNIALAAVGAAIAFRLVWRLTGSVPGAVLATAAGLWSPAMVLAGGEARHYPLYGVMLLALTAWGVGAIEDFRSGRGLGGKRLWGLAAVTCAGMLANHQFVFNAIAALLVVIALAWPGRRTVVRLLGSLLGGAVASWLVFPYYFIHLARLGEATPGFALDQVAGRASRWLTAAFDVVSLDPRFHSAARIAVRVAIVGGVVVVLVARKRVWQWIRAVPQRAFPVLLAILAAVVPATAYALQTVHGFVEGGHYIAPLWPLTMVGIAVVAFAVWPRAGLGIVGGIAGVLLASSLHWVDSIAPGGAAARELLATVAAGDAIVVDCVSRGYFPTVIPVLDPSTPVFVARGSDLVAAIAAGWEAPGQRTILLHADCPGGGDVFGAVAEAGLGSMVQLGSLERLQVWVLTRG